jgi:DNA-binding transcriptional LysR family regulator
MNPTNSSNVSMNRIHDGSLAPEVLAPLDHLAQVDLNLLVAFEALTRDRSVTRAAQRLGVTQSAMSHSLRRLRDLLRDPVLVRGRAGMTLTPRAEALVIPLRGGLVSLGRAISQPGVFDPAAARRSFCIATPDLFDVLAVPSLLGRLRREAPGVDLAVVPVADKRLFDQLETGEVDVAVAPQVLDQPSAAAAPPAPGLLRRTLFRDCFICMLRADHPALGPAGATRRRPLSLASYVGLSHAMVSPGGEGPGPVDHALAQQGLRRRIVLRLSHFYGAPSIIARGDLVLTAPRALADLVGELPLVVLPLPLPLPDHNLNLVWHERFSADPGHRWLRELIAETAAPFGIRARRGS